MSVREALGMMRELNWVSPAVYRPFIGCKEGLLLWFRSKGTTYKWVIDDDLPELHSLVRRAALVEVRNGGKDLTLFENLANTLGVKGHIPGRADADDASEELDFSGILTTTVPEKPHVRVLDVVFWCPATDVCLRWRPRWFQIASLYKHAYDVALSNGQDVADFLQTFEDIKRLASPWVLAGWH